MGVWRERGLQRAYLPVPGRVLPFLLLDGGRGRHWLVCPWKRRPRGELQPDQAEQLADVREVLARELRPLPDLAWVSAAGGVIPMQDPGGSWIARKIHDGHVVMAAG
jgi:hypothetical protein